MELQRLIDVVLSNANRPLVHIVNSDPLVSVQLLEILLRAGLRVDVSETSADFIMKASDTQPDALVIDFKLSDDDGAVLLEWLGSAEIAPTTPVFMVGEAVEMAQLLHARKTGAIDARSTQKTENLRRPPRDVVRPFARHPKTAAVVPKPGAISGVAQFDTQAIRSAKDHSCGRHQQRRRGKAGRLSAYHRNPSQGVDAEAPRSQYRRPDADLSDPEVARLVGRY
jgi:CheY-like chemotaxis protein